MELGCSREDSFRVSTVPEGGCICQLTAELVERGNRRCFAAGHRCCSQYNQSRGAGECSPPPPPPPAPAPFRGLPLRLAGRTAKAIRCHTASQHCQQRPGQLENIHPPPCAPPLNQQASLPPAPARSPALPGGVTLTNTSTLKEPQRLVEYLGLQLVRQEGVSNTGNAHPVGSGWLHTAPLPSARKESASATLPPHMVTYNTSGFSFPLLSLMCLIF